MSSIDVHGARVRALLAPLATRGAHETLVLDPAAVSADPGAYDRRVLARSVTSPLDLPSFDNSQMDGFAVRAMDVAAATPEQPVSLPVAAPIPAGDRAPRHAHGSATPIMTGSPLPAGADAVVPVERVDPPRFPAEGSVAFAHPVVPATFVRARGSDARAGELALPAGTILRAAHYGLLASLGLTEVEVLPRLRVLIVPTGNEIRPAGAVLEDAQIYDANGALLAEAVREAGGRPIVAACTSDRTDELLALLEAHAAEVDLVITVGGVSAGAYEVVRDALGPAGSEFGHVEMQPGGPQGLGLVRVAEGVHLPVVSLPGNPVSALVSFEVFLRPVLRSLAGRVPAERPRLRARLGAALESPAHLHQIRRGVLDDEGLVHPVGGPSSHLLASYARSTALIHIPVGIDHAATGDTVEIWRIDD
ncbi:gephyrin-like molybdotransferase Glp [Rathayibacter iranicus]|uniref:Molybdopterin molybdenumtransferase n=2 Tax=Rathayibacter iranicus TaxID=59737 RepID=A0AAD1ABU0_9MICO|nr:gephyrin-like molybdotransferase Glp [Rathayibacter iranicus]AZZ55373.1 molybdopterin molybdenumtransferase MoeA [Rathayibacter iranicus]MWV30896.1 molybdopterin molybdenumtransferase MoeA [Rathayibacter iranicus NCPPB 2253 = VKM Ac-1602]PPI48161.1 molybdopterin molybdenumtransferase MoeA [Rathayibacter iranicus]PPI61377.1 molybdopterin molybdenumtransferase MoeA [Rathayibacter iranicus]PPI72679.1 molybdopterin molybdenumtransferase MoeA [Rathayibacter iranicus]